VRAQSFFRKWEDWRALADLGIVLEVLYPRDEKRQHSKEHLAKILFWEDVVRGYG
jgi:hypothetical protein